MIAPSIISTPLALFVLISLIELLANVTSYKIDFEDDQVDHSAASKCKNSFQCYRPFSNIPSVYKRIDQKSNPFGLILGVGTSSRNCSPKFLWSDRIIPYTLEPNNFSPHQIKLLREAMDKLMSYSCIRFVEFSSRESTLPADYLYIKSSSGCSSDIGRKGGRQELNLAMGCFESISILMHELMHVLGLEHEHNRPDRDLYIQLYPENIRHGKWKDFRRLADFEPKEFQQYAYDYNSIMHYSQYRYSIDPSRPVFKTLDNSIDATTVGMAEDLSSLDKIKLQKLYNCEIDSCSEPESLAHGTITNSDYSIGQMIHYKCDPKFRYLGTVSRMCMSDGKWSGSTIGCIPESAILHYCTFEDDMCNWTQRSDVKWSYHKLNPRWKSAHPLEIKIDLSTGSTHGRYLCANSLKKGGIYKIDTPKLKGLDRVCFSIGYFRSGKGIGELKIQLVSPENDRITLYSVSSDLGSEWNVLNAIVYFPNFVFFVLRLVAIIHNSDSHVAIGIDEVAVYKC